MKTLFNIISLYIVHCYFFIRQENQYSVCLMTACADPGNISEWEVGGVRWVILFSKVWGLFRKFNYLILLFWLFQGADNTPFYLRIRTWMGMIFLIDKQPTILNIRFYKYFTFKLKKGYLNVIQNDCINKIVNKRISLKWIFLKLIVPISLFCSPLCMS